ncbi:MAG: bifunctional DNA primase/polymerase, partial [Planctomycetaceae bacterium]
MPENMMLPAALEFAARGWRVFPVKAGTKVPRTANGFHDATTDETAIRLWWEGKPFLNIGVATGAASGVWAFDIDGEPGAASLMDLEQRHGELPETSFFRTPRGGRQYLFTIPPGVSITSSAGLLPGVDVRGDGGYSVFPPSVRPEGPYAWISTAPIADPPQWLVELVTKARPATVADFDDDPLELEVDVVTLESARGYRTGEGRNHRLTQLIGRALHAGDSLDRVRAQARAFGARCEPPLPVKECDRTVESILGRELGRLREAAGLVTPTTDEPVSSGDVYDPELESIVLRTPSWPSRPEAMLSHGVVGDLLRRVEEETEADAVSIATTFLVALGSVIGRGPHAVVDGTRHGLNLFATIVGGTSEGRKGTSMGIIRAVMRDVDPDWVRYCRTPNLVSGEGLIDRVRDDVYRIVISKKTGEPENVLVEPGVEDKRLLCEIQELAGTMRAGRSERSTLFQTMREAWDGVDLATMSKNSRRTATEPHISIVAHVTPEELSKLQTDADVYGGSWNRFLWVASKRARLRPHGGDFDDLVEIQDRVRSVVTHARNVGRMRRTSAADQLWEAEYFRRAELRAGSVVGAIIGRAEPQLLRLSMLAALCRGEDVVDVQDLAAAISLWQYVDETVRMLFAGCEDPLASRIVEAIRAEPGISR